MESMSSHNFAPHVSTTLAFLLASPTLSDTPFVNRKRSDGNTVAAADLYGTGIRIGIYLQTLGLLLSVSRFHRTSGKGIKLIISANMIAILASWTVLVRRQEVSPCEAWLILSLMFMIGIPMWAAFCNPNTIAGEGIGIFLITFSLEWSFIASIWFWASLYKELPLLGTPDTAWIFVDVSIKGWFRIFMLVGYSFDCVISIIFLGGGFYLTYLALKTWLDGKTELEDGPDDDDVGALKGATWFFVFIGLWVWMFAIIGAEKMITSNGLTPVTDMSQPGQAIPFTIGIIVLVDGLASLVRPPWSCNE